MAMLFDILILACCPKLGQPLFDRRLTSMKLHDCEAIEIESVEQVSIGLESVKKALRKCQETNKRFP